MRQEGTALNTNTDQTFAKCITTSNESHIMDDDSSVLNGNEKSSMGSSFVKN